jgi:GWxTD domain-containing protein
VTKKIKYSLFIVPAILIAVVSVLLITNCANPYQIATPTRWNLAAIYNPVSSHLHPSYKVYHNSDLTSLLLIKLFPSELLFNQANVEGEFISKVSVQVQIYEITENKTILTDSVTYFYTIKQENTGKRFLSQIPLKTEPGKRYQLRVVARDMNRKDFNLRFIDVDKTNEFSEQNFNLINQNGIPYFNNVVNTGEVFKIQHRNSSFNKLYVHYYKPVSDLPKPVFAVTSDELQYSHPDSLYVIDFTSNMFIGFSHEGFYRFRFDTNQVYGLNVLNVNKEFPKVAKVIDMIEPLAYLTTTAEYNKLLENSDSKLIIDNYWLSIGGNTGRARELIRIFYNRVYFANYYFTTDRPGWKTDKGMVFIMYGPPQNLQKTPNSETWTYYKPGAENSINFTFMYKPTPYSIDNFQLQRSENNDWHWREAFDSWRAGEIYLSQ